MGSTGRVCAVWFAAAAFLVGGCGAQVGNDTSDSAFNELFGAAKPKGEEPPGVQRVEVCHQGRTVLVPEIALAIHLDHGDQLGPCNQQPACEQSDSDADGVNDCGDACAATPAGETVDAAGCSVLMLQVDAGPDASVTEGAVVSAAATVQVVQGQPSQAGFSWSWEQVGGETVNFQSNGHEFSFDTMGFVGSFVFRATAADGGASASDEFAVEVIDPQVVYMSAGKHHNTALYDNATVRVWGWDRDGQLGDGSKDRGVRDADASARHTAVALEDGTVWTFGVDALSSSSTPVQVPGASDVVQVAAMVEGAALLRSDGTLQAFTGSAGSCVLGGNSPLDENGAVAARDIWGAPVDVLQVAAGAGHLVALDANGVAWVWGSRFGCTPKAVLTGVVAVAAGDTDLALFVKADGTAWSMGFNLHGQLGTGTTLSNYSTARQVVGLTNVVDVAAGDRHSMWLTADGSLYTAGWNRYCQLGLEAEMTPTDPQYGVSVLVPTRVPLDDVVAVGGGELHTIAVTGDGAIFGWGHNNVGELDGGTMIVLPERVCTPTALEFAD